MTQDILGSLVLVESSKHIQKNIVERYVQTNAPQLYQLNSLLNEVQCYKIAREYNCKLKTFTDEITRPKGIHE